MRDFFARSASLALCAIGIAAFGQEAQAIEAGAAVEHSWEKFYLPKIYFGGKYDYTDPDARIVESLKLDDGDLNGVRVDAALGAYISFYGNSKTLVGIKGFYSSMDEKANATCTSESDSAACDSAPVLDPSAVDNNSVGSGAGDIVNFSLQRDLKHWGLSLEAQLGKFSTGGGIWAYRAGLGYRALNQDLSISSTFTGNAFAQDYRESLDTDYIGVFAGIGGTQEIFKGLKLLVDAEGGVYGANTHYSGHLTQTDSNGPLDERLSLDRDQAAFIGSLKAGLEQDFGAMKLAGFVRGEYYSYVPDMKYNQTDRAAGFAPSPYSISGRDGTSIGRDSAWALSVGGRVTAPFGGQ